MLYTISGTINVLRFLFQCYSDETIEDMRDEKVLLENPDHAEKIIAANAAVVIYLWILAQSFRSPVPMLIIMMFMIFIKQPTYRSTSGTLSNCHSLSLSHSLTLEMLNNFCFHVYAQKSLSHSHTLSMSHSHTLTVSLSHSLTLHMLNNFCFHVYAQKSLAHSLTLSHSHNLSVSHSLTLDMLNNFCFHVYAQKWLFIGENGSVFFGISSPNPFVHFEFIELVPS